MKNNLSDRQYIQFSMPQGTDLGPVIFNSYVNDLFNFNRAGDIIPQFFMRRKSGLSLKTWLLIVNLDKTNFLCSDLNLKLDSDLNFVIKTTNDFI